MRDFLLFTFVGFNFVEADTFRRPLAGNTVLVGFVWKFGDKAIGFTRRYGVHCRCLFDLVQIMPQLRLFCGVIIREVGMEAGRG